jgi:uroporphyrinogen-III synthase
MADGKPTLLLTRPADAAARFADDFRARFGADWPVVVAPLNERVPTGNLPPLDTVRTLIFTSEAGVAAFAALSSRRDFAVWCVGGRTAETAAAAGFQPETGPGDGAGLVRHLTAHSPPGPCLHLRGRHAAVDMAGALNSAGIETESAIIYDQRALPLTDEARALLAGREPVLLPLFSPRSARLAAAALADVKAPLAVAALSPAVAAAAAAIPARATAVAATPDAGGMLDALAGLLAGVAT